MSVRVRYAPSPTGSPHVGNIRTALFDFLFARHNQGVNVLRIEDTDRTRYVEGTEQEIQESLRYVGVSWDEGPDQGGPFAPYRQSERKEAGLYQPIIDQLLQDGHAYWAFDTSEELTEMREYQQINKQPVGYFGGMWRDATEAQVEKAKAEGKPGVIRLRVPRDETLVLQDGIRGRVEFDSNTVDDPVLIKADGMPTYHFAAMADDHLMEITHVFRGEEWISSAPKHVQFFNALGWEPPIFVHVPQIKGKDGKKLSKRHGDTACLDFRRKGVLGEALANFISLIGWAPGDDREVLPMEQMIEAFDIKGIQPSPGVFDLEKLTWMNGHYIRSLSVGDLFERVSAYASNEETHRYLQKQEVEERKEDPKMVSKKLSLLADAAKGQPELVKQAVALEQERVTDLAEFGPACDFFVMDDFDYEEKGVKKWKGQEHIPAMFDALCQKVKAASTHDEAFFEKAIRDYAQEAGIEKLGPVVHPVRIALTGRTFGPGLWQLMAVLGPDKVCERLQRGKEVLA
jgi:glutamyl-tRNA synthetase